MAKHGQSPSVSLFLATMAVIWLALSYSLGAVYEHALSDLVVGWIARWFGMTAAHLTELYGPYVAPGGAAALLLILAHRVSHWFLSQTVFAEDPHANPLTLSPMSVTEIAEYLRDKSKWAWHTYARLNSKEFVRDHVSVEMTRAGRDGEVRFIGTFPIESVTRPIDATYWRFYRIDNDRLWDGRNEFFTEERGLGHGAYGETRRRFGRAPRIDVMRTWPRASLVHKIWALSWVRAKRCWWWLKAKVSCH